MVDFAISGATSSNSISRELSDYEAALMEWWLAEVNWSTQKTCPSDTLFAADPR
jgi:hypothetical protein